jgi:hypothetical protein
VLYENELRGDKFPPCRRQIFIITKIAVSCYVSPSATKLQCLYFGISGQTRK